MKRKLEERPIGYVNGVNGTFKLGAKPSSEIRINGMLPHELVSSGLYKEIRITGDEITFVPAPPAECNLMATYETED